MLTTSTVLAASLLGAAPTVAPVNRVGPAYDPAMIAKAPTIAVPAGYGRYCSLSYPSGGWAFDWAGATDDPCKKMLTSSPGGTVARAGLWSQSGPNNVIARCNGSLLLYALEGTNALQKAFDENKSKKGCTFTVAPKSLPILHAPFSNSESSLKHSNGFDFARGFTVPVTAGGSTASAVNYEGKRVDYDGHDGHDWPIDEGKTIRAVHKGVVLTARARDITKYLPNCPSGSSKYQNEVYVLHVVGSGVYAELFVSYYAHFEDVQVETGDTVGRGSTLGTAGTTGCSSGSHLHLEIVRMSNTATAHRRSLKVPSTEDYDPSTMIDPYGWSWQAPAGFDPWSYRAFDRGEGALSIEMWASGQAPERD